LKPIDDAELEQTVHRATRAVATKHRIQGLSRKAQAVEGVIRASAPYFAFERTAGKLSDRQVQKAVDYISSHFAEDLSAKALAAILHCSESHLFKLFKNKTGYTVLEWITHYRMKAAITLMKEPSARIYEIAGKAGYKDVRYFSGVFKKHFGVTPTEYRNAE
ncbi:AraC family transcriptional regulator, partial [Desulfovibrio sp. OttesenSCG-928-I05]|nr:AraC family transcriptional regulator [Desulfovibrio sp. OttesenSCG-928-I05]